MRRLLKQLGYALHTNRKCLCSLQPERNRQFHYIGRQRRRFAAEEAPIISVDTKKRELVFQFKTAGPVWSRDSIAVFDHDFPSLGQGVAIPYGVCDLQPNHGCVTVGASRNTPAFAVESIRRWWLTDGRRRYPDSACLLILADNGGSNGADTSVLTNNRAAGLHTSMHEIGAATTRSSPRNWFGRRLSRRRTATPEIKCNTKPLDRHNRADLAYGLANDATG